MDEGSEEAQQPEGGAGIEIVLSKPAKTTVVGVTTESTTYTMTKTSRIWGVETQRRNGVGITMMSKDGAGYAAGLRVRLARQDGAHRDSPLERASERGVGGGGG